MVTVGFAMIYKIMPRVRVQWRDVWVGAAVTALLFTVGKHLIGLYIGKSSVASGYGAAGSLVVVLVWVYYSAQIFLLGAEFTWVYAHTYGHRSLRPCRERPGAARLRSPPTRRSSPRSRLRRETSVPRPWCRGPAPRCDAESGRSAR